MFNKHFLKTLLIFIILIIIGLTGLFFINRYVESTTVNFDIPIVDSYS